MPQHREATAAAAADGQQEQQVLSGSCKVRLQGVLCAAAKCDHAYACLSSQFALCCCQLLLLSAAVLLEDCCSLG